MAKKPVVDRPDLVALAFTLIAERGWRGFSFTELARRAELPLASVYAELPNRGALLRRLGKRLDAYMLDVGAADLEGLSPRERIFELMMRRFDAMAPFKEGLRALSRQAPGDPALMAAGFCNLARLSARLLDAAEAGQGPTRAMLARKALCAVYARVFGVWLDDTTPDLARTLAELDRRLQQAEGLARWFGGGRGRRSDGEAAPAPA
jgi:AcrR family transcriptional regulator